MPAKHPRRPRDNHYHAVALHAFFYNYIRQHASLNKWTPAIAAGLTDRLWDFADVVTMINAREGPPKRRGPYKPRHAKAA
jgi:hypothetical protein